MRQIVLDTETTGLEPAQGHRIIEIGCVELINRQLTNNNFHQYLNPDREIDAGAIEVHGITNEFLADKPRFEDVATDLREYLQGAELVIHNAPFDVGFLNHEFRLADLGPLEEIATVLDTLEMARAMHPGQRNSLDALCKRYDISNAHRTLHGALLDSEILADVYLAMTGGQATLALDGSGDTPTGGEQITHRKVSITGLPVVPPSEAELAAHLQRLAAIDKASGGQCVWLGFE
ncbi:MAG: DNA polymerase III subunit epsilon [Chromatiales bacterium]|nr:DNA polymerase III subunit epsilon [Chromatiales bacterium]